MRNGLSLWDNLCYTYDRGVRQAEAFVATWEAMRPFFADSTGNSQLSTVNYEQQLWRFQRQAKDAVWWRDACLLYFQQFSRRPLPPDSPAFHYTLDQVQQYHLRMDNYTAPDPAKLP
jgi:alpha-glucuronidase